MRISNMVVEVVQEAIAAIACCQSSSQPVPVAVMIVWQRRMGVLQQGDHHQPAIHYQVGYNIHLASAMGAWKEATT